MAGILKVKIGDAFVGINAVKGDKGAKGDTGPAGPAGAKGDTGAQGPAGEVSAAQLAALQAQVTEKTAFGVVTGLNVTTQSPTAMAVIVQSGTVYMANGDRFTPSVVANQVIEAADATHPRIDIIYVSSAGAVSYLAGTAAAAPAAPAVPAGGQKLAEIRVGEGATAITVADIADRRKSLWAEAWITAKLLNNWAVYGSYTLQYCKGSDGIVRFRGRIVGGTTAVPCFTLPEGYRPTQTLAGVLIDGNSANKPYTVNTATGDFVIWSAPATYAAFDPVQIITY